MQTNILHSHSKILKLLSNLLTQLTFRRFSQKSFHHSIVNGLKNSNYFLFIYLLSVLYLVLQVGSTELTLTLLSQYTQPMAWKSTLSISVHFNRFLCKCGTNLHIYIFSVCSFFLISWLLDQPVVLCFQRPKAYLLLQALSSAFCGTALPLACSLCVTHESELYHLHQCVMKNQTFYSAISLGKNKK